MAEKKMTFMRSVIGWVVAMQAGVAIAELEWWGALPIAVACMFVAGWLLMVPHHGDTVVEFDDDDFGDNQ